MTDSSNLDAELPDETVREMVAELQAGWTVEGIERLERGTDFVARLVVRTADDSRTVVLKATTADLVAPEVARAEPRLVDRVGRETSIPVPEMVGYCDEHPTDPAPFYLLAFVPGENLENRVDELSVAARDRIVHDAGRYLAALHDLGPLPANGTIGVRDGDLAVLETDDHPRYDDYRDCLLDHADSALEALEGSGYFPDLADEPERFADLVPDLRSLLHATVPDLPAPDPPTYAHTDYRYGNLLVDPETGRTRAVLDWANVSAADPAYNLAAAESLLLRPDRDPPERTADLRRTFRTAYADAREGWAFDESTRERMRVYRLVCRLHAMACLPLWYEDATPDERDEREADHRAFVREYIE